jgi:hypothetical protein
VLRERLIDIFFHHLGLNLVLEAVELNSKFCIVLSAGESLSDSLYGISFSIGLHRFFKICGSFAEVGAAESAVNS